MTGRPPRRETRRLSAQTILALYDALDRHDGPAAAACYTPQATFRDPAFGRLDPGDVRRMWAMLTARSEDLAVELTGHGTDGDSGWASWTARYTFGGADGRKVVNVIQSRMRFQDGLIADQLDTFDLRRWGAQAMGPVATVLGAVGLLKPIVQRRARGGLAAYDG